MKKTILLISLWLTPIALLASIAENKILINIRETNNSKGTLLMKSIEIKRIKDVWEKKKGTDYKVLVGIVRRAENILSSPIEFPIRGGQHNQWYQCSKCEVPLRTLSQTKHQCTGCGKIYSGFPYDDFVFAKIHNNNVKTIEKILKINSFFAV